VRRRLSKTVVPITGLLISLSPGHQTRWLHAMLADKDNMHGAAVVGLDT
jgi:hypothetical protein